ncbi:unnamed protein product (macronuclear) [Paramecium tetraurelia]|uniref:Transmembrane protein n=1 Tax=Paramecium tetraurelia TaxID=5888 RepID=A0BI21_PARTE|nr:uncharacterized protein GSPATT00029224001 [Paramecium tetraurelia]CAK58188.1 unnamed protein product [Paramecium tetraurelia]|eukprot:XP_001425586.1 hypothetical protein (macronuclear) [Paramecium tetraurelia strain d4-2]
MFSLLIFLNVVFTQEIKRLTIGHRVEGTQSKWLNQNGDFYELILEEIKIDSDIVIMVKAINPGGDPNIFISRENKYASNEKEGEIASCTSRGNDLCIIDKSKLIIDDPFYISVICTGNCRYDLRVDYDQEYTLQRNDFIQFKLSDTQQSEILKIDIGEYSKSEVELEIEVKALNIYEFEAAFQVYLNVGTTIPTSSEHQYVAKDSWSGSKLMSLSLQELPHLSKLTLVISGQAGAIFQIKTQTSGILRELKFQEIYNGIVEAGTARIFKVKIEDNSYNDMNEIDRKIKWFIKLTPFIGHATLYANPDYQPVLLEQYQYHFERTTQQVLIIEKAQFKFQSGNEKYLYIAVFGNEMCTYELETGIQDFEYQYININVPYEGNIENNEMINYWFVLSGSKTRAVTVELTNYDQECALVLKRCYEDECKIIQDDLNHLEERQSQSPMDLFIYTTQTKNNQILVFNYDPEVCKSFGDFYSCTYVLAIYPSNTHTQLYNRCSYSVLVSTQSSHIQLKENTPHKSMVERQSLNYFKFYIGNAQDISRISIILTPIQGIFQIYSSTTSQRPNKEDFEMQGSNYMIRYQNQEIREGTYFISVFGETAGLYTITVVVIRTGDDFRAKGKFAWQYIQLYEGSPQDFTLFSGEVGLYKIDLTNYLNTDQSKQSLHDNVKVEILHETGQLSLYGFDHPSTKLNESRWQSAEEIQIQFNEDEYPEVIYLRVEPTGPFSQVSFRIIYRIGWKNNMLVLNENFYTWIEAGDYQYFYYTFFKNEDVQLTKRAHSHKDSELIVTAFVDSNQHQLITGSMILSASKMPLDKCKSSITEIFYCQVQVQVTSTVDTFYSLLISKDNSQIQLTLDEPVTQTLPASYHHYYLFYQPENDVVLNVVNFGQPQPLQILVSVFDTTQYPNKGVYEYPTDSESKNIVSVSKTIVGIPHSQVTLSQGFLQFCQYQCVLAITIKKVDDIEYYITQDQTYSIQYSSGYVGLYEQIAYYGSIDRSIIKYYKAYVYDNDTNLMIVLTPMSSCDVNIVVSKDDYPDAENYDWASIDYLGDQLVIESGNPKHPKMAGLYIIGVIGYSTCSYSIVYQTGKLHYYQIQQGIPHNIVLKSGEVAYFKYQQYIVENFQILFILQSGTAEYFVDEIADDSKESDSFIKQLELFQFNNSGKGFKKQMKFTPNDRHKYLIAVRSEQDSDITLAIQVKSSKVYLAKDVIMINQLDPEDFQSYSYYSPYDSVLKVEVLEGKVEVQYSSDPSKDPIRKRVSKETSAQGFIEELMKVSAEFSNQFNITIKSFDKSATYKIQCRDIKGTKFINVGEVYTILLHPHQSEKFIYNSVQKGNENTFSIFITMLFNTYQKDEYNKYKKEVPKIFVKYTNENQVSHQLFPDKEAQISQYYYAEFQDRAGDYEIEIFNKNDQLSIDFNLIFSNSYLNILVPSQKSVSILKQQPKYWEYFCPSEGQLLLQVQQCGTTLNLFGSTDIDLLKNGQYSKQYQVTDHLVEVIEVKKSGYYYLVASTNNYISDSSTPFTITAQLIKQDSYIPLNDLQPGNDGNLNWELERRDDKYYLTVTGYKLQVKSNPNFNLLQVAYVLVYQFIEDGSTQTFNYCFETYQFEMRYENPAKENQLTFSLSQELDETKLADAQMIQFTIYTDSIIQLRNQEMINLEKFYKPITVNNEYIKQLRWKRYMKYTFILILAFALIYTLISYFRKKMNKEKMKFEATDYPNIEMHYRGLQD